MSHQNFFKILTFKILDFWEFWFLGTWGTRKTRKEGLGAPQSRIGAHLTLPFSFCVPRVPKKGDTLLFLSHFGVQRDVRKSWVIIILIIFLVWIFGFSGIRIQHFRCSKRYAQILGNNYFDYFLDLDFQEFGFFQHFWQIFLEFWVKPILKLFRTKNGRCARFSDSGAPTVFSAERL